LSTRQQRIQSRLRRQMIIRSLLKGCLGMTVLVGTGAVMLLLYHQVLLWLVDVEVAQYRELQDMITVPAILVKQETVVTAPTRGRFENQVMEGERVRGGSVVGLFYPEGQIKPVIVTVPRGGIISFEPDGWEQVLDGFSLEGGDRNIFDYTPRQFNDGVFQYERGEPICKVIDNLVPLRMVVRFETSALSEPLEISDTMQLIYRDEILGKARCESVWSGEDHQTVILNLDSFNEDLLVRRKIDVDCVTAAYQGVIIAEKALVKKPKGYAAYRIKEGKVELCPLKVLKIHQGQAVVEGIQAGDTIVTTPYLVSEGMTYR
jgi:putative membrane fusion protein